MRYVAQVGDRELTIGLDDDGEQRHALLGERALTVDWQTLQPGTLAALASSEGKQVGAFALITGQQAHEVFIRQLPGEAEDASAQIFEVSIGGQLFRVRLQDERTRALAGLVGERKATTDATIRAPMPGLVSNVLTAQDSHVEQGATVVVLEAMKMENDLMAPRSGVVKQLLVAKGQTVNQGDTLAVIGDPDTPTASS